MNTLARAAAVALVAALGTACAPAGRADGGGPAGAPGACNEPAFLRDRALPAPVNDEVTVCGTVASVRAPRRTRSGLHQYFFVALRGARPVEVVCNDDEMGGPIPVRAGQRAVVHGRYYKDPDGREGIDWTHAGTGRAWSSPGYVVLDGRTYQ